MWVSRPKTLPGGLVSVYFHGAVLVGTAFFLPFFYRKTIWQILIFDKLTHCHVGLTICLCIFADVINTNCHMKMNRKGQVVPKINQKIELDSFQFRCVEDGDTLGCNKCDFQVFGLCECVACCVSERGDNSNVHFVLVNKTR